MKNSIKYLATLCLTLAISISGVHAENIYRLGVVPQFDSRKTTRIWLPIIKEIKKVSGITIKLVVSPSIPEFEKSFYKGEFDIAYMNPYHALVAHQKQKYYPVIRDVGRELYGIIVVRKDSPIKKIRELDGKKVAFPAPNALGAALIPRAEFAGKFKININPMYVKSHDSVYLNVILGHAVAGGGVQKTLQNQSADVRKHLRVLYKTRKVAPHPIVVHPRVSKQDVEKFRNAILTISQSETGKVLMLKIPMKEVGKAALSDYLPLKKMNLDKFYKQ